MKVLRINIESYKNNSKYASVIHHKRTILEKAICDCLEPFFYSSHSICFML